MIGQGRVFRGEGWANQTNKISHIQHYRWIWLKKSSWKQGSSDGRIIGYITFNPPASSLPVSTIFTRKTRPSRVMAKAAAVAKWLWRKRKWSDQQLLGVSRSSGHCWPRPLCTFAEKLIGMLRAPMSKSRCATRLRPANAVFVNWKKRIVGLVPA